MLVVTRKHGESVRIGEDIEVSVEFDASNKVRLGIRAPRTVPILRSELLPFNPARCPTRPRRAPAAAS